MNPVARRKGLVVRELPGELLVYDLERHQAHCLNETAAVVFRAADGHRSVLDIAEHLAGSSGSEADAEVVRMALERLADARLLESAAEAEARPGMSRRDAMRRVGLGAAVLLPVVTSVLAPTPTEAAATCVSSCSGQPNGTPCSCFSSDPCTESCVSGLCSDGGGC